MKKIVANISQSFIEADVYDISKKIKGKFDLINLSNVLNYVSTNLKREHKDNRLEIIYRKILYPLKKKLNKKGRIFYYYFYRKIEDRKAGRTPLANKTSSLKWIKDQGDFKLSKFKFKGILWGRDAINILELIS